MATKVIERYKQKLASFELEPSRGGCFEVTVDGNLIYSKLASGQFPAAEEILSELDKRAAR